MRYRLVVGDITRGLALAAALLAAAAVRADAAAKPIDVVRDSNDAVLAILAKHAVVDAATEKLLFAVIDPITEFDGMAKAVIDPFCAKLAPGQCDEIKRTFTRLLRVSSIKKLGRYRADRFDYDGEQITGDAAVVRTFAWYKQERIPLDYHLAQRPQGWVIANYVVDEVDTIRNYRKQFTRLFAQETYAQVHERLLRKIAEYEAEK